MPTCEVKYVKLWVNEMITLLICHPVNLVWSQRCVPVGVVYRIFVQNLEILK